MRLGLSLLLALAGGLHALALAWPLGELRGQSHGLLQLVSLVVLAACVSRSTSPKQALWQTLIFSTSWLTASTWWLYISMHVYGGMPSVLAAVAVILLSFALSGLYGLCLWAYRRWVDADAPLLAHVLGFTAAWTLADILRGTVGTGFPWGAAGYAHIDSPLRHFAPWLGVYGLSGLAAALAMLLAAPRVPRLASTLASRWMAAVLVFGLFWMWGASPSQPHEWASRMVAKDMRDTPTALRVSLLQGNVPQDLKFGELARDALQTYQAAMLDEDADLVVTPETALTFLPEQIPATYWQPLREIHDRALLMGLPMRALDSASTNRAPSYTNSVLGIAPKQADYRYDKHHLVPFGEFVPPFFQWFMAWLHIPMGDFAKGPLPQAPFQWKGQRIGVHICFEDLFGEELAQSFADPASSPTLLLNVSNLAWFGDTVALDQHLNIARMRALELGRPMLRATNTGATAVINAQGEVVDALPYETQGVLRAVVHGVDGGNTPYVRWVVRWGLWPLVLGVLALAVWAVSISRHSRNGPRRFRS